MSKAEVVAAMVKAAHDIETHPDSRDAAAVPPWLKTLLALLAKLLPEILPLIS